MPEESTFFIFLDGLDLVMSGCVSRFDPANETKDAHQHKPPTSTQQRRERVSMHTAITHGVLLPVVRALPLPLL